MVMHVGQRQHFKFEASFGYSEFKNSLDHIARPRLNKQTKQERQWTCKMCTCLELGKMMSNKEVPVQGRPRGFEESELTQF